LVIDYVPNKWLLESKSLKLFLSSFRNHGAFHEDCTVAIGLRLAQLLKRIGCVLVAIGIHAAGFPSTCFGTPAKAPADVWIPDQGVPPYHGRG